MNRTDRKIFGITGNPGKEKVWELLPKLLTWFSEHQQVVYLARDLERAVGEDMKEVHPYPLEQVAKEVDLLLALGGDGSILHTARLVGAHGTPILGIRLGGLGFLAEVYLDEIYDRLHRLVEGTYNVERRMTLAADVAEHGDLGHYIALNDFVFNRAHPLRMLAVRVCVNGGYLNTYSADGLIISSPTGSTAYSLSAQGPIIVPSLDAIVINPINPHSLTARPVVVPADSKILVEFESNEEDLLMSVDGQIEVSLTHQSVINVTTGEYPINLVVWEERTFFDVLRRKMQWGSDPRNNVG